MSSTNQSSHVRDAVSSPAFEKPYGTTAKTAFVPSSSNPLMSIAKHYGLEYADVLLYADLIRTKTYNNRWHELDGHHNISRHFKEENSDAKFDFHDHVMEVIDRLDARPATRT